MSKISKLIFVLLPLLYIFLVYKPLFVDQKMPIPADVIVGVYYPWRDYYLDQYPSGIPFKNILVTDSIRQLYPWRKLAIEQMQRGEWPLWNPYAFSGYPLLANVQSAPFYPLNVIYWLLDFNQSWSLQVLAQTLLGLIFMAMYLRSLKLRSEAVLLGAISWAGCGFFISWLTSNTIVQTAVWLPLLFWSTELLLTSNKKWFLTFVLTFALGAMLLAGHLQTAFYALVVFVIYMVHRIWVTKKFGKVGIFALAIFLSICITSFWWLPVWEFIGYSARDVDQLTWQKIDWFIPWQHLVQFVAPDYFGNPSTLNYFGVWNYGEFVGYVGIIPLIFACLAIFSRRDQKGIFVFFLIAALAFALPTALAKIPFQLNLPLISSAQPSRLLVIIDFSLAVLAAFGFNWFINSPQKKKWVLGLILIFALIFAAIWLVAFNLHLPVSLRNLYVPSMILGASTFFIVLGLFFPRFKTQLAVVFLLIVVLDLSRFATKFVPFSTAEWLFPETAAIKFLQDKSTSEVFRIGILDDRIMSANFSTVYHLQAVSGYDPLYLLRYGEFAAAIGRNQPDIEPPFGFNRAIALRNKTNSLYRLLGAKYLLSIDSLNDPNLKLVFQEGQTKIYEDPKALPRAFFVANIIPAKSKQEAMNKLYAADFDPAHMAVVEGQIAPEASNIGQAEVTSYTENEVVIETNNPQAGFLVVTDIYYPGWQVKIDGQDSHIYRTDYVFRGVNVPAGHHLVEFKNIFALRAPI